MSSVIDIALMLERGHQALQGANDTSFSSNAKALGIGCQAVNLSAVTHGVNDHLAGFPVKIINGPVITYPQPIHTTKLPGHCFAANRVGVFGQPANLVAHLALYRRVQSRQIARGSIRLLQEVRYQSSRSLRYTSSAGMVGSPSVRASMDACSFPANSRVPKVT